jgi:spore coat protein A
VSWSSPTLAADVQSWLSNPSTNFGWVVVGQEGSNNTAKRFDTREIADPTFRPVLQVTYSTGSEPTGACCFQDGSCDTLTQSACEIAGGTYQGDGTACAPDLCTVELTPFVDPLPIPPLAVPTAGQIGGVATYDIEIREVSQKLHRDLPPTRVWGYDGMYPGPTILAFKDRPVTVNWINDLRDSLGNLRTTHYLPVDTCVHGPDMEGATARVVSHLHGGHVPAAVDGYPTATILPGEQTTYVYPNHQTNGTLWYHDHALGITRLNVMMGLAGFYLLKDSLEVALDLPEGEYEIGLAIQDRAFHADGSLKYPATWEEHFFGDKILVNGKVWPFLNVKRGKYRFHILGGSNSRTYTLTLSNNAPIHVIGTEGGLLPAPVTVNTLTVTPGERFDVIIDFAAYAPGTEILLTNSAPAPFPGAPGVGVIPDVMKFIVTSQSGHTNPIPPSLIPVEELEESDAVQNRDLTLRKITGPEGCGHSSIWTIDGLLFHHITEYPELGSTEIWNFVNPTGVTHPMHMHLVMFQILDRTPIAMVGDSAVAIGPPVPPDPWEGGWKDTAPVHPDQAMRVIARFDDYTGKYPYHCHILEHEENEMMRQFEVIDSMVGVEAPADASSFALAPSRPNPFDQQTSIAFELPRKTRITLKVYDVRGRLVRTLVDGVQPDGKHQLQWDGEDSAGKQTPAGIYFVRLTSDSFSAARKVHRVH